MNLKQKKYKKGGLSATALLLVVFISFFYVFAAKGQEQSSGTGSNLAASAQTDQNLIVVATIGIHNTKILDQQEGDLKISFDISNRQGIQPGVQYEVLLQKIENGQFASVADEKLYSETLTLGENSSLHKEVSYQAPKFLSGEFEVWVISKNDKGLMLALGKAGTIKLNGGGESAQILPGTCFLTVNGDDNKYTPEQGVDIAETETLQATCEVRNGFKTNTVVVPRFELRYRSSFGETVSTHKLAAENFNVLEQKPLNLVVPKPDRPQAYEAILTLLDNKGRTVSNAVNFHFVLQGVSATIQNLKLDKNSYVKGDAAKIQFSFTSSADNFEGARGSGTSLNEAILKVGIKNNDGMLCGSSEKKLFETDGEIFKEFIVPIGINCADAVPSAILTDKNGNVLDAVIAGASTGPEVSAPAVPEKGQPLLYYIFGIIIFILLVFGLAVWKKKKKIYITTKLMLFFAGAAILLSAQGASADTVCVRLPHWRSECFAFNLNGNVYPPNATITATATVSNYYACVNPGWGEGSVTGTINGQTKSIIPSISNMTRSETFTGEGVAGSYQAYFDLSACHIEAGWWGPQYECFSVGRYSIPYNITAPQPANGECVDNLSFCRGTTLSSSTPGLCVPGSPTSITGNINGPWNWYCSGQNGGSQSSQCSASIIQAPQCRTITPPCEGTSLPSTSVSALCAGSSTSVTNINDGQMKATWNCKNSCGESTSCEVDKETRVEGECGSADGTTICDDNTSIEWCAPGNTVLNNPQGNYLNSYDVSWQCAGTCGGQTADCSARGTKACGWIETSP